MQEIAEKAMPQLNAQQNDGTVYKLVKVVSAKTQVVAGMLYYLTIVAAPTTCKVRLLSSIYKTHIAHKKNRPRSPKISLR